MWLSLSLNDPLCLPSAFKDPTLRRYATCMEVLLGNILYCSKLYFRACLLFILQECKVIKREVFFPYNYHVRNINVCCAKRLVCMDQHANKYHLYFIYLSFTSFLSYAQKNLQFFSHGFCELYCLTT